MKKTPLTTDLFFDHLSSLKNDKNWEILLGKARGPIRLCHKGQSFDPLTAVYYVLSGGVVINSCFLAPDLTQDFGLPESEVVELAYASDACICVRRYSPQLRDQLLQTLGLPEEKVVTF